MALRKISSGYSSGSRHFRLKLSVMVVMLAIGVSLFSSAISSPLVPQLMNFQGRLTDPTSGLPFDGVFSVTFRLYEVASGPDVALWTETQLVTVDAGLFNVLLGSDTALDPSLFIGTTYLGVEVESNGEMTPRQQIVSVGYAFVAETLDGLEADDLWQLGGNTGTTPGTDFLGTSDNEALELHVNGTRALRIEPASNVDFGFSPNLIEGHSDNSVSAEAVGATISGGGKTLEPNRVMADFGTVAGGSQNTAFGGTATVAGGVSNEASSIYATVGGGEENTASGDYSFAIGRRAKALHDGAFVWGDSTDANFASTTADQFNVRAAGGTRIFSDSGETTGVELAAGATGWSVLSDQALKENFVPLDGQEILNRLNLIPITQWNLKSQGASTLHIGPMAQDFYAAFGLGESERHISTIDADGIALLSIQALYQIVLEKDQMLAEQSQQIEQLSQQVNELQIRLATLEQLVTSESISVTLQSESQPNG